MVEEGYDAWNRGDFDAMVKNMADDAEWRTGGVFPDFDPVYRGYEGVRRFWDTMHDAWELIEIRPRRFVEHGDKLLIESRFHGKTGERRGGRARLGPGLHVPRRRGDQDRRVSDRGGRVRGGDAAGLDRGGQRADGRLNPPI